MWITLTREQNDYAQRVGIRMRKLSLARGHRDYRTEMNKGFTEQQAIRNQALGAIGELAVRKYFGYRLELVTENYHKADLPDNIEVKVIGNERYGLRIYPRTTNSRRVVGVVIPRGMEREPFRLAGWIVAGDGKQQCWSMSPHGGRPMYCVPQFSLRPMSELLSLTQRSCT